MKPTICFITIHSPFDLQSWSGLNAAIYKELNKHFYIVPIYGFSIKHTLRLKLAYRLSKLFGKNYFYELSISVCKQMGEHLSEEIPAGCDAIFTLSSHFIPYLKTDKPVFLYRDATFKRLYNYYSFVSNLTFWDKYICNEQEKRAFQKCTEVFMASEWAAESVRKDYGVSHVTVAPFGANFSSIPTMEECKKFLEKRDKKHLHLLFLGKDFVRKGGVLAQQITEQLNRQGISTKLHVFGEVPNDLRIAKEYIYYYGFSDKNNPEDLALLTSAFQQSHILLLPTQAECFGIVFSEAAAYGIPSVSFATGGVPTAIKNGINGYCIPQDADLKDFVSAILKIWSNYPEFSIMSRHRYEKELNWGSSISLIAEKVKMSIKKRQ